MSDIRLPQRPFVELAPPMDGLDQVRGEAGRRRRRRAGLAAASLTTAAGVAVVMALSGAAGGVDVLKPAPPAGQGFLEPSPTATGTPPTDVVDTVIPRRHPRAHTPGVHRHAESGAATGPGSTGVIAPGQPGRPSQPAKHVAGATQPTLTRWQSTYTEAPARECSGSTYGDGSGSLENSVGWCLEVTAKPVSGGVRLHIQLCRDSTGGGSLSFDGTREVDLAVQQAGRTVWDWATLHPGSSGPHQFSEPANGCMNWSLVWPGVTTGGESAGHGSFTFVGTSTANEMKGKPNESVDFAY